LLLQSFYGIRCERQLLEQLHDNLLFRWFVGLSPDDPIWHPTTFTKNHKWLLHDDVMGRFLEMLIAHVPGSAVNPRGSQLRPLLG
jgi:transposase